MAMPLKGLKWWMKEEILAVPVQVVNRFKQGVEAGLQNSSFMVMGYLVPILHLGLVRWPIPKRVIKGLPPIWGHKS